MARSTQINTSIGIVVPTLGRRPDYLLKCLESIRHSGAGTICLVAPEDFDSTEILESGLVDQFCLDPGKGLAAAINIGISALPANVCYVNWLGDDDLLKPGSVEKLALAIDSNSDVIFAYGGCDYIDGSDQIIWTNQSGSWAARILGFGPDLIPQPSSLFLRSAFEKVSGLNEELKLAFDFDLFLRLSKIGKYSFVPEVLASFRWHADSLSVSARWASVNEASLVRQLNRNAPLRFFSLAWEPLIRLITFYAGVMLSRNARDSEEKN